MHPSPIQTGNGMMEMLKAQLMTMTMVSSMNGSEKSGNFFNVIYIFWLPVSLIFYVNPCFLLLVILLRNIIETK